MDITFPLQPARTAASPARFPQRMAGFAGLAFAILVAIVNIAVGASGPPAFNAAASDITPWVMGNRALLTAAAGVVPFGVILLYAFVSGAVARLSQGSSEAAFWARFGAVGVVVVEIMFLARVLFELVLVANIDRLAGEPALVEVLWQLQSAATILTGLAIGIALTGLSRAARQCGLIPAWHQAMGFAAASGFLIGAIAAILSLEGSPIGIVGLPAFLAWLAWLALTSRALLRDANAPA